MSVSSAPHPISRGRDGWLCVLSVIFPNLGLMLAGLELAYGRYRFGAMLLFLAMAPSFFLGLLVLYRP